jgi:hypothetical protein
MDAEIVTIRRDICQSCERACEVRATITHTDPCTACPEMVWHAMGDCEKQESLPPVELRGLGDAVAVVAQPIARAIDAVFKTNVQGCGGCKARQAALNKAIPFQ